eukprot:scaffold6454_cov149-Skeletonema_dohrnii-CCMP3373.AAC.2
MQTNQDLDQPLLMNRQICASCNASFDKRQSNTWPGNTSRSLRAFSRAIDHSIVVIETVDIADLAATVGLARVLTVAAGTAMTDIVDGMTMIAGDTTTIGAGDLLAATVAEVGAVLVNVMVQDLLHAERVTKLEIYLTCHLVEEAGAGAVVQMTTVSWTGPLPKREKGKSRVVGAAEVGAGIVAVVAANEARAADVEKNLQSVNAVEADRGIN